MTSTGRASLGFDDDEAATSPPSEALKSFDPKSFVPSKRTRSNDRPDVETIRKAGERAGFVSREGGKPAMAAPQPAEPRRRRNHSGRSEQVNIKATPEFKARFQALAAKNDWTDAVTFEKAIELLERQCNQK